MHALRTAPYAIGGLCLIAAAWGLQYSLTGTDLVYGGAPSRSLPGALNFWLAYLLLVVPGSLLIGFWTGPAADAALRWAAAGLAKLDRRTAILLWIFLACSAVFVADQGFRSITQGFPLTDDELVARFGGQIMASGQLGVALTPAEASNRQRFTVTLTDGRVTSFEWLGGQLAWAAAELSGTGYLIFALCAGLTLAALALAIAHYLGRGPGWLGAALFLCSPMAVAISVLTHTHTVARLFVALAILAFILAVRASGRIWPLLFGLALGSAFLTRPVESGLLLAPLSLALLWDIIRNAPRARQRLIWTILGGLGPLLLLLWYQWAVTGDPFSIPRFHASATGDQAPQLSLLERFGRNLSHNLLMLALWFAGPIGVLLVTAGISHGRTTKLLATGVGLLLLFALMHPFAGVHMVGPINYSEALAPLLIIATVGATRLCAWWRSQTVRPGWLPASALVALVISGIWFNTHSLSALQRQSEIHATIFGGIEAELDSFSAPKAVIFAPRYLSIWAKVEPFRAVGTFVYDWPRANPDGSSRALFLTGNRSLEGIHQAVETWPERTAFVLQAVQQPPWIRLIPLDAALQQKELRQKKLR